MSKFMALKPRMSEKAYGSSKTENTYVFVVPQTANKATVAEAVADQFNVTVENVRIAILKGKTKQSYRKRQRPAAGKRVDIKKAYVRIKAGDKIGIFGEEEKAEKAAEKKAAKEAKTTKRSKKEDKK